MNIRKNLGWLKTLRDNQIMALASQNGIVYTGVTIKQLRNVLAELDGMDDIRKGMQGQNNPEPCCD